MNPHFISNTINAIESLVNQERNEEASEYLIDFSRLCRLVIDYSRDAQITLQQEIDTLKYFLSLEKLRLAEDMEYTISVDNQLSPSQIMVPPLILQPFVENAINHGLFHLKRRGTLTICMRLDEADRIICTISDDGIGRKAAAELRRKTYRKHKNRATQIVTERLDIFQRTGETDLQITTEDLHPEREETGTKVVIVVEEG